KKETQQKYLDKLKKFPEIKDSLTYITIGHLSKERDILKKGLDLENLHIKDYIQFCAIEFPDLNKINFKTLMNGMILNGSNWVQYRNHFEHAIQVYVPLDLLTTGFFTGNYNIGYYRIALNNIAANIAGNVEAQGAYNVVFMKNLIHKLAISCFDYDRYILYETHKNDLTSYFYTTNFPEEMNIHFATAHDGGIGQGNLVCRNADGTSRQVSFRLWFDKVFITPKMIKEKQKQFNKMRFEPRYLIEIDEAANFQTKFMCDLALCRNNTSFLEGLQILLEEMLPNGRHELEDYKSQMNLININITDTPAFFTALSRVYDYYKSGKVGEYFRNQSEKKQANYLNKLYKTKEYFDNEKKRKENRFKKNDYAIISLRNMKWFNCGRKGYLMNDCRSKKQEKGYNKGKKFSKERFSKDRKEFNKKGNGYTDKKGRTWKSKEEYKKWKKSRKEKDSKPFKPKEERTRKLSIRKCSVITVKQTHILPIDVEEIQDPMVLNLEKAREREDFNEYVRFTKYREQYHLENKYSSSEESQSYQEPEQYKLTSESSESDGKYESYNLEKKTSSESKNDYYF
ncbi:24450_t:CDS:2, partial [Gigaspora rosea]